MSSRLRMTLICSLTLLSPVCGQAWGDGAFALQPDLAEEADPKGYDVLLFPQDAAEMVALLDWEGERGLALVLGQDETKLLRAAETTSSLAVGEGRGEGPVRIRRREGMIEASREGLVIMRHWLPGAPGGSVGPAQESAFEDFIFQPVDAAYFDYGFANLEGADDAWRDLTGDWKLGVYRDDLFQRDHGDFGPFGSSWYEIAAPDPALTVAGPEFWDRFRARVAVLPPAETRVGLAFYVQGKRDHALFSIFPHEQGRGIALLSIVRDDVEDIIAREFIAWRPDTWYELAVEAYDDHVKCFVSGRQVLAATLPAFTCGGVGLFADGPGTPRFDDVSVRPLPPRDAFHHAGALALWEREAGDWRIDAGALRGTAETLAACVFAPAPQDDAGATATITRLSGLAGVGVASGDGRGYGLVVSADEARLIRLEGGEATALASRPLRLSLPTEVAVSVASGRISGRVDDLGLLAYDAGAEGGRTGLLVEGQAAFDEFAVGPPPCDGLLVSRVSGERLTIPGEREGTLRPVLGYVWRTGGEGRSRGRGWSAGRDAAGEPALVARSREDAPAELWYAWACPGDVEMIADGFSLDEGATLGLEISSTPGEPATGYAVEAQGGPEGALRLSRQSEVVAEAAASAPEGATLSLRRDGPYVVARLGEKQLVWRDDDPLSGVGCGAYVAGRATVTELQLRHHSALHYAFRDVETDWQPAVGDWMARSGMACIPWDYWMTGSGTPVGVTWNIRPQPANLHMEGWVSEHTLGYETGEHRHFPYHDISLITSAASEDRDSGYRFVVGAEQGRYARILRLGKVVAETDDPRFRIVMGGHNNTPRIIHVAALQRDGELALLVNGETALRWQDPDPLPGGLAGLGVEGCTANFRDLWLMPWGD